MIRTKPSHYRNLEGWPRTSGDDPLSLRQFVAGFQLAPHERG